MDEKRLIVYLAEYDNQNFWAYISNFLYKFYRKAEMKLHEVDKIFTSANTDETDKYKLLRRILDKKQNFLAISKPEKLYDVDEDYENLFCIYIDVEKLSDVVELQKLYLICKSFESKRILVIIEGEDDSYFIISHFLKWVNIQNEIFYNRVYYHNIQNKEKYAFKRMERKRAAAFERLLPLLEIDAETDRLLRSSLQELFTDGEIEAALEGKEIKVTRLDLKNSALRQLKDKKDAFKNCEKQKIVVELKKMNLLTLILFADSLTHQKKTYKDTIEVQKSIIMLKRHVQGYLQLTENILFHTREKVGVFCLRLLDGNSKYVQEKYAITDEEKKLLHFEISISDYSGNEENGNLAQTFINGIDDVSLRQRFEGLKPVHFFQGLGEMDKKIQEAWEYYYNDVEHVGKHYGLKIFKTLVSQSRGKFVMESHSTHQVAEGECIGGRMQETLCMPGTSYSILMPMNFERQYINAPELDFGIANVISYETDIDKISNIQIRYCNGVGLKNKYSNQDEKYGIVNEITDIFKQQSPNCNMVAVDAAGIPEGNAELIYKALIKLAGDENQTKYVAFYNCSVEFVRRIWEVADSLFETMAVQYILRKRELQIIFYTQNDYEEMIIIPHSYHMTMRLNNHINFTRETKWRDLFRRGNTKEGELWKTQTEKCSKILPFDVMLRIEEQGEKLSIFEHYTKHIVNKNIQQESLGCKFENTHMRLGSTIHVGQFYEAEFLFGINLFVERFALLMAFDLKDKLKNVDKLTLYGYAAYSEHLINKLSTYIQNTYKDMDIDYVILEREAQERGTKHTDRIRYSKYFVRAEERREYFKARKLVCIVPISSTLKTNEKLINMFCENNGEACRENILEDYEIILVGDRENDYWKIVETNRINSLRSSSLKMKPRFFIRFDMKYEESLRCSMCFPEKVLDEIPLIEVNAASTIPNQAFGIQRAEKDAFICKPDKRDELEKEMRILKDCFLYSHTKNGDAHFLFYVQTNLLMIKRRKEIVKWLEKKKREIEPEKEGYNVIFCPTHARNVGFAECINEVIFDSSAIIIQDDIDKEYRSNFFAKYSNIYLFVKKVAEEGQEKKIRFFYADDAIITGRSFQRAKSLLKSIVKEFFHDARKEYCIFDSIFVLIDRNSEDNRKMYVGNEWGQHFFSFCSLHVSSLRTHGDACVLCNLENDADRLKMSSVGMDMYKYWEGQKEKFTPDDIEIFLEGDEYKDKRERAFRRLVCANEAGVFLSEKCHGNYKEYAIVCILQMIVNGCNRAYHSTEYDTKAEMQREYFLSYCKILSRPFIVFNKAVKEAVFDFLLIFTESVLMRKTVLMVIKETEHKLYLQDETIISLLEECEKLVEEVFLKEDKDMELLHVLLKQLTELKSNYVIRVENINKIVNYMSKFSTEEQLTFYERYISQVKRLLGVSSDTSKSARFDYLLFHKKEYENGTADKIELPDWVYEQLYVENNRVISDAILKLCQKVKFTEEEKTIFNKKNFLSKRVVSHEEYDCMSITEKMDCEQIYDSEERFLQSIGEKIESALKSYLLKDYCEVLKSHTDGNMQNRENMLPVAAQILLYQYIDQNFGDNLLVKSIEDPEERKTSLTEQGKQIAIYLNYILRAKKTYILLESVSEADIWEDTIIERFNTLACRTGREELILELKKPKEYLQLGNSWDENRNMIFNNRKFAGRLKEICNDEKFKKKGYYFSLEKEEKILIWRLGMEENQVYVCSELEDGRTREEYLNDIRNALQFSYRLNHRVFNVNNTEFFMEIVAAAKNLSYSLGKKVVTHTPYMIRMQQYMQLDKDVSEEERKTDIIMLLADLNISTHYRDSLRKDYYIRDVDFKKVSWSKPNPVFTGEFPCSFAVPIGEFEKRTKVIVRNEGFTYTDEHGEEYKEEAVSLEDELICYAVANPSREVILMLYLMITNSAVEGRSETVNNSVDVFLSKTARGELRISNKLNKQNDKKIKDNFLEIPPYDEEGISIWTVSRYLKSFAATILNRKLLKVENGLSDVTDEEFNNLREKLQKLPEDVQVHIEYVYREDEEYFSIVIPIFAEKYKSLF